MAGLMVQYKLLETFNLALKGYFNYDIDTYLRGLQNVTSLNNDEIPISINTMETKILNQLKESKTTGLINLFNTYDFITNSRSYDFDPAIKNKFESSMGLIFNRLYDKILKSYYDQTEDFAFRQNFLGYLGISGSSRNNKFHIRDSIKFINDCVDSTDSKNFIYEIFKKFVVNRFTFNNEDNFIDYLKLFNSLIFDTETDSSKLRFYRYVIANLYLEQKPDLNVKKILFDYSIDGRNKNIKNRLEVFLDQINIVNDFTSSNIFMELCAIHNVNYEKDRYSSITFCRDMKSFNDIVFSDITATLVTYEEEIDKITLKRLVEFCTSITSSYYKSKGNLLSTIAVSFYKKDYYHIHNNNILEYTKYLGRLYYKTNKIDKKEDDMYIQLINACSETETYSYFNLYNEKYEAFRFNLIANLIMAFADYSGIILKRLIMNIDLSEAILPESTLYNANKVLKEKLGLQ